MKLLMCIDAQIGKILIVMSGFRGLLPIYRAVVFSSGILQISHLDTFLAECHSIEPYWKSFFSQFNVVVGWGHKKTADRGRRFAAQKKLTYVALEDGFLRSVRLGRDAEPPLSLVVDPVGIYYDARQPSLLEQWLEEGRWSSCELQERAQSVQQVLQDERLSKYNLAPEKELWPDDDRERVLVIDQTFGDMSVVGGLATEQTFRDMLQAALNENPQAEIVVKTHPDVLAGHRNGYLGTIPSSPSVN